MGGPFSSSYSGLYRVLQREKKILLLQLGNMQELVWADRLKPHAGGAPVEALPPKRSMALVVLPLRFQTRGGQCSSSE